MRHDVHKPRPSSVDNLTGEPSDGTESEEVFYTYRYMALFVPLHVDVMK